MKSFLGWLRQKSVIFSTYLVLVGAVFVLFGYKNLNLIPGADKYELQVANQIEYYEYPWRNPIDAPYISVSWLISKLGLVTPLTAARVLAVMASVASVVMFYHLLRNWLLSPGKALVGTTLFATSSWYLAVGRGAHSVVVGVFLTLLIFTLGTRLLFTTKPFFDWLILITAVCLALYTPLLPWLVFVAGIVSLMHYRQRQRSLPIKLWHKIVLGTLALLLLTPLVLGMIHDPNSAIELLGVNNIERTIPDLILNMIDSIKVIFFIGLPSPISLGKLPMLDIFSVFMFMLGCYYFERRLALKRSKLLFTGLLIGLVVCSLVDFDIMRLSLLIPIIYIFISAGIHESITRWLAVFPKNPIARGVGVLVLTIAVGFVSFYHLRKVFIARPGNPEVRSYFVIK